MHKNSDFATYLMAIPYIVVFGAIVIFLLSLVKGDKWIGIYESRSTGVVEKTDFTSREECSNWLRTTVSLQHIYTNFECGNRCTPPKTEYGLYKCDETFD